MKISLWGNLTSSCTAQPEKKVRGMPQGVIFLQVVNAETKALGRAFRRSPVQTPAQSGLKSELRPGCSGFCPDRNMSMFLEFKTQKTSATSFHGFWIWNHTAWISVSNGSNSSVLQKWIVYTTSCFPTNYYFQGKEGFIPQQLWNLQNILSNYTSLHRWKYKTKVLNHII